MPDLTMTKEWLVACSQRDGLHAVVRPAICDHPLAGVWVVRAFFTTLSDTRWAASCRNCGLEVPIPTEGLRELRAEGGGLWEKTDERDEATCDRQAREIRFLLVWATEGMAECRCGCGAKLKPGRRFLRGHNARKRKEPK
jgi:hypothetical protein